MQKKLILRGIAVVLGLVMPLAFANDAPVEDLTSAPTQAEQSQGPKEVSVSSSNGSGFTQISTDGDNAYQAGTPSVPHHHQEAAPTPDTSGMTVEQRLGRLEQQNAHGGNASQQIADLQQEIQQLRGQLQVQQHDMKMLNEQHKTLSQDVGQQLRHANTAAPVGQVKPHSSETATPSVVSTSASNDTDVAATKADSMQDMATYNKAFALLRDKKYSQATGAFENYLSRYPQGEFRVSAHYWLGEIYLQQNKLAVAQQQFNTVITEFPKSNKVPDAHLKIAMIHVAQGKSAQARKELQGIKKRYPGTTAAQLASIQLQQMASST